MAASDAHVPMDTRLSCLATFLLEHLIEKGHTIGTLWHLATGTFNETNISFEMCVQFDFHVLNAWDINSTSTCSLKK